MARILAVGNAVLDLVFTVPRLPAEDEELRAEELRVAPGGNAANTARVLRALGHEVALAAVLGDHPSGGPLRDGLHRAGIELAPSRLVGGPPPLSCVLSHPPGGTRTVVHHRALPEYTLDDLIRSGVDGYDWVHFEARPGPETARMVRHLRVTKTQVPLSIEVEKARPGIEECLPMASLVLFSRGYVRSRGHERPEPLLRELRFRMREPLLVAAWGDAGAWGIDADGSLCHAPAFRPPRILDVVGAGDAFNAGVIDALLSGQKLPQALEQGCRLAGRKVGQVGLDGLGVDNP